MFFLHTRKERLRIKGAVFRVGAVIFGICAGVFSARALAGVLGENLHVVVPGKLIRSAQLSIDRLDEVIAQHGIASVISLRKEDPPAPEFAAEIAYLERRGMSHANVPMSPLKLPAPDALESLLAHFDAGPYPMLVHCEEGADRTGLACVIWLVVYEGRALDDAIASELSWTRGHIVHGQAHAMDDFFALYRRTSDGRPLRDWITSCYPEIYRRETSKESVPEQLPTHSTRAVHRAFNG